MAGPGTPPSNTGCPVSGRGAAFDPFDHEGMYRFFAEARREEPVFYSEALGYWVVTRRKDVLAILRDPDTFSAGTATEPLSPYPQELLDYLAGNGFTFEPIQVSCDRPRHTRVREAAGQYLNAKTFLSFEPRIRELARGYVERMKGREVVDLVADFTYEFPARVVFLLLGLTDVDPMKIKRWGDNRLMMTWGHIGDDELMQAGKELDDFFQFCRELVEARAEKPGDDYASRMIAIRGGDDAVLTMNEIVSLVFGLLLAGHETTTNASSNLILELLGRRRQWDALVAEPTRIPNAVEEGLRYCSSVVNWRRQALRDVEIGGTVVPQGSKILISLASANHDEAFFEDSESFDIGRRNARNHIAFGTGIHVCIGAQLARIEMRVVLEELTCTFPDITLVPDQKLDWVRTISFRGPHSLLVRPGEAITR